MVSADPSVPEAAAFLERLQKQAEETAFDDDLVIEDEQVALLPDVSDSDEEAENEDVGALAGTEGPGGDGEVEVELPWWVKALKIEFVLSSLGNVESFFSAVILRDGNLKIVFCLCVGGQVAMYVNLLLVQHDIQDTGLFLALLQMGAVLLGLQSAQGVDHFKQAKTRSVGDGDAGRLLYKLVRTQAISATQIMRGNVNRRTQKTTRVSLVT